MDPVQNEKGEWVIPASRRPDGTWRKEKLLKEGYVPQEEVKAFATRASKSVKKGIPGLPPPADKPKVTPKKSAPAQAKPKEAEKPTTKEEPLEKKMSSLNIATETSKTDSVEGTQDPAKRLKALKKKLRDINEILAKPQDQLTPEQVEKISKKTSIEEEIASLENV